MRNPIKIEDLYQAYDELKKHYDERAASDPDPRITVFYDGIKAGMERLLKEADKLSMMQGKVM